MSITKTLQKNNLSSVNPVSKGARKANFTGFMATFGAWGKGESGTKTVRTLRLGWKKRLKRLGL